MAVIGWDELTPREAEVLAAVERRLTNTEIAAEMVVSVRTVETHIAALRRKLGADSRAKLISAAGSRRGAGVPVPTNSFVGRDDDLAAVRSLLDRDRWVTLVGPPGCGKTRLALELAASDGRVPVVVELEHHGHPAGGRVVAAVAKQVGIAVDRSGDPLSACGVALATRPSLLVLDNADRVSDEVREVVGRLLSYAAPLTVLATSRAPLGASDETVYAVSPLPVGDDGSGPAVRLFLDRAGAVRPAAEPDVQLVRRICRRLDGLPLAIELAAARARHLSLSELAARLDADLDALDRVGPASRHRTLATAFDWTWDLLDDEERSLLSRLAALPRTFDLDLAEAVSRPGAGGVLMRLLDRSLVTPTSTVSEPQRFRLLRPLRTLVRDRTDPAVADEVRRAHARYFAVQADRVHDHARTDDSRAAAATAARLCPEVNAALHWALGHDPRMALRLACALSVGGEQYGPDLDSLGSIARAARDPLVRELARPVDLFEIGMAQSYANLDLVAELAALALDRVTDSRSELAARHLAGYAAAYRHEPEAALAHLEVAERVADEQLDMWQLASVRQARGIALRELGNLDGAMAAFESAMHTFGLAGDAMHVNNARYMMAATAADSDRRTADALEWVDQCLEYASTTGSRHERAHAELTRARLSRGSELEADLVEAVGTFRAVGDLRCLARSHLLLADRTAGTQRLPLLQEALASARAAGDRLHEEQALQGLVLAHWDAGSARSAATTLGELVAIAGWDRAAGVCPPGLLDEIERWETAIAQGQARNRS